MRTTSAYVGVVFLFLSFNPFSWAQAPVEELSVGRGSPTQVQAQAEAQAAEQSATVALYLELQTLRTETSLLRGMVEELSYEIQRLQSRQATDYANLDSRILQLSSSAPSTSDQTVIGDDATAASAGELAPPQIDSENAAEKYSAAIALLRNGDRAGALEGFNTLIDTYPGDPVVADAYYWVGETHWVAGENEEAREAYTGLVEGFQGHRKYGEALYKLARVYLNLNDTEQANALLLQAQQLGGVNGARASELLEELSQQQP
jgi:TolA-binding protein